MKNTLRSRPRTVANRPTSGGWGNKKCFFRPTAAGQGLIGKAWPCIKSRRRDNVGIPLLRRPKGNGILFEEAHEKAEILAKQYNSVFTKDNLRVPTPENLYCLPRMPEITIEVNGVMKLLK